MRSRLLIRTERVDVGELLAGRAALQPRVGSALDRRPVRPESTRDSIGPSVRSAGKDWQPPEGLAPEEVLSVIDAAPTECDRLLLCVLWATGAHISEVPALRPIDVRRASLVLPNLKNPNRLTKRVFLPTGQMDLRGALLLWAKEHRLAEDQPPFRSKEGAQMLDLVGAWQLTSSYFVVQETGDPLEILWAPVAIADMTSR